MRENVLAGIQIFISLVLIFAILMQQRGSGVGAMFGGPSTSGGGEYYRARRGVEKFLFYLTVVMGCFLVITSFAFLFV